MSSRPFATFLRFALGSPASSSSSASEATKAASGGPTSSSATSRDRSGVAQALVRVLRRAMLCESGRGEPLTVLTRRVEASFSLSWGSGHPDSATARQGKTRSSRSSERNRRSPGQMDQGSRGSEVPRRLARHIATYPGWPRVLCDDALVVLVTMYGSNSRILLRLSTRSATQSGFGAVLMLNPSGAPP